MLDRVAAHFLTADGTCAQTGGAIHPYRSAPLSVATRRPSAIGPPCSQLAPGIEDVVVRVQPRSERRARARRAAHVRDRARAVPAARSTSDRVLDFSDVLQRAARPAAAGWTSSRRAGSGSRHATTTCSSTSSRTRAARSGSSCRCSFSPGAKGLGVDHATRRSSSSAIASSRSIASATPRSAVLQEAGGYIEALRPAGNPRRSITQELPRRPELLAFVNELFGEIAEQEPGGGRFTYTESDRFPIATAHGRSQMSGQATDDQGHRGHGRSIPARHCGGQRSGGLREPGGRRDRAILREDTVRDRKTGVARRARPGDIGVLFRSRTSHREFERALERRAFPTYVYKGLGFFDADEIKDAIGADPVSRESRVRPPRRGVPAVALRPPVRRGARARSPRGWRTRSDPGARRRSPARIDALDEERPARAVHWRARFVPAWLAQVDRVPPADLFEAVLAGDGLRLRAARAARRAGLGEREEDARPRPPHPEPRLRHAARGSPITSTR